MLSSTSDDSSNKIPVQRVVDVNCLMDERHFLLKPPPPRRIDGQRDRQTEGQADGWTEMDRQRDRQTDGQADG